MFKFGTCHAEFCQSLSINFIILLWKIFTSSGKYLALKTIYILDFIVLNTNKQLKIHTFENK